MLIPLYMLLALSCFAQSNYKVTGRQETKFKEKYKLTARLDEKKLILYVETNGFDVLNDVEGWGIKRSANAVANPCKTKTAK